MKKLIWLLLFLPLSAFGQGVRYENHPSMKARTDGALVAASATVAVCTQPANTGTQPCSPLATLYTDSTLSTPCTGTLKDGSVAGATNCSNPLITDAKGNYHFYTAVGKYTIQVFGSGLTTNVEPDITIPCDPSNCTSKIDNGVFVVGANQQTLASAITALGSSPGTILMTPGTYTTSATITLSGGQSLLCTSPTLPAANLTAPITAAKIGGCIIQASGLGNNLPVINVHNAAGAIVRGINVDCNNITGCINFLYDATGPGISTEAGFDYIGAIGGHFSFVAGLASTTADTNNFEADTFTLTHFQFYGNCADTTATGILVNSGNAANHSTIAYGNIQCINIGTRCVKTNGLLDLRNYNGGSAVGANTTFIQADANCSFSPHLFYMETEGAWTFPVHDSSSSGTASNPIWISNQFNTSPAGTVLIDGNATIVSMGAGGSNTVFSATGSAKVLSINETVWTPSANVATFNLSGSTLNSLLKSLGYIAATSTQSVPGSLASGQLASVTAATTGTIWLGSDGLSAINRDSAGNINSILGFRVGAGDVNFIETTAPSAGASADHCYGDSTAHALECSYNNGSFGIVPLQNRAQAFTAIQQFTGNRVALTADWTCGTAGTVASCVAATIIGSGGGVPLTFTLPLVAQSYRLECDLVVGQATAATANNWNLLTATNGATNVTTFYDMYTAATAKAGGATTDQASTTTTFNIGPAWTLGGTATKMPVHIWAQIEGASASGTVVSIQLVAPTVGDLVTIYRGSSCQIH